MGVLYKGVCFPSADFAQAEFCSGYWASYSSSTGVTELRCAAPGATKFDISTAVNGVLQPGVTPGDYPVFPACGYDSGVNLSSEYFSAVLAFLVIVWLATRIKRMFWGNHEGI